MTDKQLTDKVEEWKNKFLALDETLQQQQKYGQLLERSLGRLALAAQGIDPMLDEQLSALRRMLRHSKHDVKEIESILEKLEQALSQLEDHHQTESDQNPAQQILDIINEIQWPDTLKTASQKLLKKYKTPNKTEINGLISDLVLLLNQSISNQPTQAKQGLLSKIFQSNSKATDSVESTSSSTESKNNKNETSHSDDLQPHTILIQLLERLSLPDTLSNRVNKLRLAIQNGIKPEAIPDTINAIADIISELGSSAVNEKKEYENFLIDLTKKITSLDKQLVQIGIDDADAYNQKSQINQQVEQEMKGIRSDVDKASEINELKQVLDSRIEHLNQCINHYQQVDSERFTHSQQKINALNKKLHQLELETKSLKLATEEAREMALKDALTGIWNRQALTETLEQKYQQWRTQQQPLTLVIWDVDFFKKVNDQFGHSAGDIVLKTVAQIFIKSTRKSDFIARFGGEEFVSLFTDTSLENGLIIANKIRESIAKTNFKYKDISVPVTVSAGLASFEHGDNIDDVFNRADRALYDAKEQNRNNCQLCYKDN